MMKIVGHHREIKHRKTFTILRLYPVVDWNELTHHLLEVIFVYLQKNDRPIHVSVFSSTH